MVRLSRFKATQAETGGIMVYEGTDNWPMIFTRVFTPSVCKTLGQARSPPLTSKDIVFLIVNRWREHWAPGSFILNGK